MSGDVVVPLEWRRCDMPGCALFDSLTQAEFDAEEFWRPAVWW